MQQKVLQSLGLLSLVVLCGCPRVGVSVDPNLPPPTPVSGAVTFGGEPLGGATVIFSPTEGTLGSGGTGVTDAAGKYQVQSMTKSGKFQSGVAPGKYAIKFSRMLNPDGSEYDPKKDPDQGPIFLGAKEDIPTDYSLKAAFTMEVTKDKKDGYDFALEKKK